MPTDFSKMVAAGGDDGHAVKTTGASFTNSAVYVSMANDGGSYMHAFHRFTNVTIPAGSTINSAIVRLNSYGSYTSTPSTVKLHCELADNPSAPSSGADLVGRSLDAGTSWTVPAWTAYDNEYDSPDFASKLQDIIDRAGWNSGQAIQIHFVSDGGGNRRSNSYNGQPTRAAELIVNYTGTIEGEIADQVVMSDQTDAFNLTDTLSDSFSINDLVIASGGSSESDLSDGISINDQVTGSVESDAEQSDSFTLNDTIQVQGEYNVDVDDGFTIGDIVDAFNWAEWVRENGDLAVRKFYLTLTGDADGQSDLDLKFSSFQSTKRNGEATYLSVIVPGLDFSSAIVARSNGDLMVEMAYLLNGVEAFRENIIEVDLENIRIDEGPRSGAITLSGSRVVEYKSNLITLENPIYKYVSNGKIRYRFLYPDPWINPGDVARCRSDEFVIQYITYTISDRFKQMEISEV